MIFSICQSILIQTETNIVLNNSLHLLVRAPHDAGLFGPWFGTIFGGLTSKS